jgi:transposase
MEQDQIRLRAIHALIEGNLTQEQTALLFGVSRQSVNAWFRIYQEFGVDGLRSLPRGRHPGHTKLSPSQSEQITQILKQSPRISSPIISF